MVPSQIRFHCATKGTPNAFLFFFCLLGLHLQHMEVPRLEVKLELQLPAFATATATEILAMSVTYTIAYGNTSSLTH